MIFCFYLINECYKAHPVLKKTQSAPSIKAINALNKIMSSTNPRAVKSSLQQAKKGEAK